MTSTALVRTEPTGEVPDATFSMTSYLQAIATPAALDAQKRLMAAYDKAVEALVGPGDVQEAEEGKQFKKKSAWCKLARHFGISTRIARHKTVTDAEGHVVAEVVVAASAPWGQTTEGIGACSTRERRFRSDKAKAKADHDCLATAATRARNRAIADLIAQGEVSAEEVEHHAPAERPARQAAAQAAPVTRQQVEETFDAEVIEEGPACPKCGGADLWDNRAENDARAARGEKMRPDYKCKKSGCDGVIWRPKEGKAAKPRAVRPAPAAAPVDFEDFPPALLDDDSELPF